MSEFHLKLDSATLSNIATFLFRYESIDDDYPVFIQLLLIPHTGCNRRLVRLIGILPTTHFKDNLLMGVIEEHLIPQAGSCNIAGLIAKRCAIPSQTGSRKQQTGLPKRSARQGSS